MKASDPVLRVAAVIGESFRSDLLAEVAGVDPPSALDALSHHSAAGMLRFDATAVAFVDAAARQMIYQAIPPSERVRIHARTAEVLLAWRHAGAPVDPEHVGHHLHAAGIKHRQAAAFFSEAGDRDMELGAFAAAERQYQRALEALTTQPDADAERSEAWIALGGARLARGDAAGAWTAFRSAIVPARLLRRGDLLGRAALGLGSGDAGFEVGLVDRAQIDLLEEALALLPEGEGSLRARVMARLAVALTVVEAEPRRRALATEAVELARHSGDRAALGAALAAKCDASAGPEDVSLRRGLADEIVTMAREGGEREVELLGRRIRLVVRLEIGDLVGVDAELRDFAALSEVVGRPLYGWYVPLWRGMRALMEGRFEDCRQRLAEVEGIGSGAESHNAFLLACTLRWCLLSETADHEGVAALSAELVRQGVDEEPGAWPAVALGLMAAESGRLGEARVRLDSVAPRLAEAPRDSEWLPMLAQVAELVGHLGGHGVAGWTYDALLPFADLFVVEGIAAATRGSLHRHLGLLASTLGRTDEAAEHFDAALRAHRGIGAPLLVARTHRDRALVLGDRDALRAAVIDYQHLGVETRVAELRAGLGSEPLGNADGDRFVQEGRVWTLAFRGRTVQLADAKGLHDLALLLAHPGRPVPALALIAPGSARPLASAPADMAQMHVAGDLGEVLDATARDAYRRRLQDLHEAIDDAERFGDQERAARAKVERDQLVDQLSAAYGLAGRLRRTGDPVERARTAVTARIRAAIFRIAEVHPDLGRHLRASIRTGTVCVYAPERSVSWTVA